MDAKELFSGNKAKKINESLQKNFGKKINLESFSIQQLEDARNKLRTQLSQVRAESGFNENIENEAYFKAQFMLDAINAEILSREQLMVDSQVESMDSDEVLDAISQEHEDMTNVTEGEIQQASAIVTAKTMVDRVGRWIEELSGMENDTLLQLGDSIRDEIGQEQAKAFIEAVAPAIQQALDTLKGTRDSLSNSVRSLASGEQPADMLGAEPEAGETEMPAAEPDTMNAEEPAADEFAAAEPAAGGPEAAGREQRESIQYQNRLLKVLAG